MSPIVCIYCKETRDRPARGEHVVLEALGGNTTIADVCGGRSGCNQKFGDTIDRELLRNSLVTLHRLVVPGGGDHEQQMFFPREDHGVWLDVLVRPAEQDMSVLPQLYLHDGKVTAVASPEFDSERLRLASSTFADLAASVRYIQDIPQYSPRIVLQTWRRRLILRARSGHEAENFLEVLREKLPRLAAASNEGSTDVTLPTDTLLSLPLSTSMNDGPRCAAKMAFNFLSLYCGPEVALQAEFDSVRDYITGRNVEPVREIVVGDEIGLTIDTRHVANWAATDLTASPWNLLRDAHHICLSLQGSQVCAEVGLFGGRCRFLVRLGKAPEGVLRGPLPAVFLSPIGGGGDRVLAGNELHEALHRAGQVEADSARVPNESSSGLSTRQALQGILQQWIGSPGLDRTSRCTAPEERRSILVMWLVRAGRGGENLDDFLSLGIVAFNDEKLGKLSTGITKEDLLKLYAEHYPEAKEGSRASWGSQIFRLINEVKVGDDVATWDPNRRRYVLGKIASAYEWIPREGSDAAHARRVAWQSETPRESLLVATKNTLGSTLTVFKLNEDAEKDLRSNAVPLDSSSGTVAKLSPAVKSEDSEKLLEISDETFQKADAFIEDQIDDLSWEQMQELVAGILRAMGYRTTVTPPGPDRGVDVFASKDGLGLEEPRIFVEVKHRTAAMGSKEIRAFVGGRRKGDKCLYVSTGGFSKDALYEADRADVAVTLITLPKLRKLVVDFYEKLDPETRALVPLRRLYWPVVGKGG